MRILAIDIETSPNLADVWGLWNNNVSLSQLRQSSELLCFAASWIGEKDVFFYSRWDQGHPAMVRAAYSLLDEADVVMHYNGKSFDIPYLNKEFLLLGLNPPAPYQQIDLYRAVKKRFKFPSYKLAYVSKTMGFEGKVEHEGHELWVKVMAGDPDARKRMEEYNKQDVVLLEKMYEDLIPWIPGHPNKALIDGLGDAACTSCGSDELVIREQAYTLMSKYEQKQCLACGTWNRTTNRTAGGIMRGTVW